jgi:undecaprenyl diphosphate synthase
MTAEAPGNQDLPRDRLPRHIAFIMDGNGRWAEKRGLLRLEGHEEGAKSLQRITRHCRRLGIREVTYYALSAENYQRRPHREIRYLMKLLVRYLIDERPELEENQIRLKVIGNTATFPSWVRRELDETLRRTEGFRAMVMRLALNYGSRQEILAAIQALVADAIAGRLGAAEVAALSEETFRRYFQDPEMSDPDLVIRTAGEFRLSNFLLWQCSYSELWITDRLWPDFGVPDLEEALQAFLARERKYGAVEAAREGVAP